MITPSLWDVADEESMPAVRDMTVGPASTDDVQEFCRRYHYTGLGNNAAWRYGLWCGPVLYGVVSYNLPTRITTEMIFGPEYRTHVWHMGRLALAEDAPHNSESRLIGGSLRLIKQQHPETWAVVTYASIEAGHIGYVYQATNAIYTGTADAHEYFLDENGRYRSSNRIRKADGIARGWTYHRGEKKHRYVYILGNRKQRAERRSLLRLSVLPYPKTNA